MSKSKLLPLLLLTLLPSLPARSASPVDSSLPRGNFVELHSCEVFAGPCVINSEVDQAGNYILRAWQFDAGSLNGVSLNGLTIALLEKSDANLAVPEGRASSAVAYLPTGLSAPQRAALLTWLRRNTAAPLADSHIRIVPLQAQMAENQTRFSAGNKISFTGATPTVCNVGGCGEMLWYQPRVAATSFVVDQLGQSHIVEPLLSLNWMDHGRRTLFVGRFGDPEPTVPAICGAPKTVAFSP